MDNNYKITEKNMPVAPIRAIWLFPGMSVSFEIGRDFSKKAFKLSENRDKLIFLVQQVNPAIEEIETKNLYDYGVVARIKQNIILPDGNIRTIVEALDRAKVKEYFKNEEYLEADLEIYEVDAPKETEISALKRLANDKFSLLTSLKSEIPEETIYNLDMIEDSSEYIDTLFSFLHPHPTIAQKYIEIIDIKDRYEYALKFMEEEIEIIRVKDEIGSKVKEKINKNQKEFFLREQLQLIKNELEEDGLNGQSFEDKYREKINSLPIEEEYKEHLLKELSRLEYVQSASPEANVIRTYLDTVLDIPFGKNSDDNIDIQKSREILDKEHHGLEDVKERILEFLAVKKLKENMKGSILCLVGPPGVGKTSIVKSVAESMNREYISMRLGGMSDESEIRGHRKTYIGAMPGRIIASIQRSQTLNPVFLLDEIDKISSDYRADPASALLEVLDPNQNDQFIDRYIEIPVDLSNVMFVTTANTTQTIPRALLDRMEVIEISGYTEYDKQIIAKKYLFPKQLEEHGLKSSQVSISDAVIKIIIKNYTRESGVRNLERQFAKISRKAAMKIIEGEEKISVTLKNYREFLGREKILDDDILKSPQVGVVTGLAWTQVGGELLQIEVNTMKGKGKLQLTGSLGDVMKESAMAALSFIRANQEDFNLDEEKFENTDIHIHVPEGATPKDGPSAGITITTALVSSLTGKKVRQDIAMTGEVTLRGRVLPIGGLREKALAALRYGIKNVIIPKQNKRDLEDLPQKAMEEMTFYPVSDVHEVLKLALMEDGDA